MQVEKVGGEEKAEEDDEEEEEEEEEGDDEEYEEEEEEEGDDEEEEYVEDPGALPKEQQKHWPQAKGAGWTVRIMRHPPPPPLLANVHVPLLQGARPGIVAGQHRDLSPPLLLVISLSLRVYFCLSPHWPCAPRVGPYLFPRTGTKSTTRAVFEGSQ